jgi:hypothetical protein
MKKIQRQILNILQTEKASQKIIVKIMALFPEPKQRAKKVKGKVIRQSISALTKKADSLFSHFIRERDKHTCISCGKTVEPNKSQCGHYISRANWQLRFSLLNCNCQCAQCNRWMQGNMVEYRKRLIEKHGEEVVKKLESTGSKLLIPKRQLLEMIIKQYGG